MTVISSELTSTTIDGFEDGNYTWNVTCRDRNNNLGRSIQGNFTVFLNIVRLQLNTTIEDNHVDENSATTNNGQSATLDVREKGSGGGGTRNERSYLRFNISAVPLGSTISVARLCMRLNSDASNVNASTYHLFNKTFFHWTLLKNTHSFAEQKNDNEQNGKCCNQTAQKENSFNEFLFEFF